MWERASNTVYDLLVGHEVGHALFTPDENWLEKVAVPPQFVNVVEDARIEKMMKRKYAGLLKTFYHGYKELQAEDFFSISDSNVADLNLADRANLYFKVGNFIDISFTEDELTILRMIEDCETFDEALQAAEELYLFCKNEKEEKVDDMEMPPEIGGESDQPANQLSDRQQESSGEGSGDSQKIQVTVKELTTLLMNIFQMNQKFRLQILYKKTCEDLVNSNSRENIYVEGFLKLILST
jgi:hypothetical protein